MLGSTDLESRRAEWAAWKEATFGTEYEIWHDGLYTGSVSRLRGDARQAALEMLRLGVALGDSHAAEALAAMGDAATVAALRGQLKTAQGSDRIRIALALHALTPDAALAAKLVGVLRGHPWWGDRIDAAIGLRHFSGEEDESALLQAAAGDPDSLVRYHASESLLHRWGVVPADISEHRDVFSDLCGPARDEEPPTPADFERFARARRTPRAAGAKELTRRVASARGDPRP